MFIHVVVLLFAAWALPLACLAQTRIAIDQYTVIHHEEGIVPEMTAFVHHALENSRHGIFFFGRGERLRRNNHGDALGGWSYEAAKGVRFGVGAGMHDIPRMNRLAAVMALERWKMHGTALYEGGHGRPWFAVNVNSPTWHHVGGKFLSETHLGSGPGANFALGPLTLWGALLRERHIHANNIVIGIVYEHELPFGRKKGH